MDYREQFAALRDEVRQVQRSLPRREGMRAVQQALLDRMARSNDATLAELAREVRSGRMTLGTAATSFAYRDIFAAAGGKLTEDAQGSSIEDLRQLAEQHPLDELVEQLERDDGAEEREPENPVRPAGPCPDVDDDFSASIMVDPTPVDGDRPRQRWARRWTE